MNTQHHQRLVYLVTELGYFCSHRLHLALAAKQAGYQVTVVTNCDERPSLSRYEDHLKDLTLCHIPFHRSRLNPFREFKKLWKLLRIYRNIRPDIVHQVALKPVFYGTLCARLSGVKKIINALGGMGYLFTHKSVKSTAITPLVRIAFRLLLNNPRCTLILQNPDDIDLIGPLVGKDRVKLIRGSGVDLRTYHPTEEPPAPPVKALMVSRLLWSKGISELIEAAILLKKEGVPIEIQIAGDVDPQNPASIPPSIIQTWQEESLVTWLGARTDIPNLYKQAHIAVLPSYREGLPKALLEAAACGKPIVTTDVPGCREVVTSGENGILIPPRSATELAEALKSLAEYKDLRLRMGKISRRRAEEEFDEAIVIKQTLELYREGV